MAKQSQVKTGASRIRFIMLDAEIPEGDLSQITQAIQNALKPAPIANMRAIAAPSQPSAKQPPSAAEQSDLFDEEAEFEEASDDGEAEVNKPATPPRQRKVYTPKVLELDLNSPTSLSDFVAGKTMQSDTDRYLAIAAWFKDHRQIDAIGPDHVYTCFRAQGWSTASSDFGGPLRKLKAKQVMGKAGDALYAINHLGLDRVRKMGGGE